MTPTDRRRRHYNTSPSFFPGQAVNIEVSTFIEYRSLCNKIWQIFIFYSRQFSDDFVPSELSQVYMFVITILIAH